METDQTLTTRDLTGEAFKPGTHDCVVLAGTLAEPYSGRTIAFRRGQTTSYDYDKRNRLITVTYPAAASGRPAGNGAMPSRGPVTVPGVSV